MNLTSTSELREQCAQALLTGRETAAKLSAFLGLDGFVDDIIHVVDKRKDAESFEKLATISKFSERLAGAAGKSTNVELVTRLRKLGGNGPIMANAMSMFGVKVTYLGNLGYPALHPIFNDFARTSEVHSIAEPGYTDALEFDDGKIMMGKHSSLKEVTWENIQSRYGREPFIKKFSQCEFVGFVNWTMLPYMSNIWEALQTEVCPQMPTPRRTMFFDLADPEKRKAEDISGALKLISRFQKYFDVILGLNEKEAYEIGKVLGLKIQPSTPECLSRLAREINRHLKLSTLVVHPVTYALAVSNDEVSVVEGPYVGQPLITTGAGDHFNAGFCIGKLLGLDNAMSLLTGVTTSGFYVRTAQSPTLEQLADMMRHWTPREGA